MVNVLDGLTVAKTLLDDVALGTQRFRPVKVELKAYAPADVQFASRVLLTNN